MENSKGRKWRANRNCHLEATLWHSSRVSITASKGAAAGPAVGFTAQSFWAKRRCSGLFCV